MSVMGPAGGTSNQTVRIGIAIEVPEPYGSVLRDHRSACGDPEALRIVTHITLVPPTEFDSDLVPALCSALGSVAQQRPGFVVGLRGAGSFRPISPVVFVAVDQGIEEIVALEAAVREAIAAADLALPDRVFDFHPHVTVAHLDDEQALDQAVTRLDGFAATFVAKAFGLYVDRAEGWEPVCRFAFAAPLAPHATAG